LRSTKGIGGSLYVILAAMLWGTTGTAQAFAPDGATPLSVGFFRLLIGGLALLFLAISRGGIRDGTPWSWRYTLMAGVSAALYQLTFFSGVALTGVAVGTIIGIGSTPIFMGILGYRFRGERLSRRWFIATGVAITGSIVLVLSGNDTMRIDLLGVLLSLGAGLSYAVFSLVNKHLLETHRPDAVMAVSFCVGTLLMLPLLFMMDISWVFSLNGLLIVIHMGVIATGLSYALFGRGLQTVPVSIAGTLTLAEPLTASLLGIFILHEQLTLSGVFGVGLLFCGLGILAVQTRKHMPAPAP